MEGIQSFIDQLARMQWSDYLDIVLVAFLIYKLLPLIRTPSTMRIARAVLVVVVIAWATDVLHLYTLSYILNQFLAVGLMAVIILFQPELRRMLDHLGSVKLRSLFGVTRHAPEMEGVIAQVVQACEVMSRERVGALMVFAREVNLDEYMRTGTVIDAQVSEQLIRNIFFPLASLHDGAMIIRDGKVYAAACILPLSENLQISRELGTRHRAAVGISEVTDSVTVVVSEETGAISVAVGGVLKRHLAPEMLERLLRNELCPVETQPEDNLVVKLYQKLQKKEKGGKENEK